VSILQHAFDTEIAARSGLDRLSGARPPTHGPVDIFLCVVDHYEPSWGEPPRQVAQSRHVDWLTHYPRIAQTYRDWTGRKAVHTFFYPWDEFDDWEFGTLQQLCHDGAGETEIQLHHHDDTALTLRRKLFDACARFRRDGALTEWANGTPAFGFVHGNWALDNSRIENGRNYCGVDNELGVLIDAGCYADFTFPAWRHFSQPRQTNSIYYAAGADGKRKAYDRGERARVGKSAPDNSLLLIQGPLVPSITWNKHRPKIVMDDGDLAGYRRFSPARLDRWVGAGIHVDGRPDRIFIKLHCHGAHDNNRCALLTQDLDALYSDALRRYNDGSRWRMHFVTAREMFNIVKCTEDARRGLTMDEERDYILKRK